MTGESPRKQVCLRCYVPPEAKAIAPTAKKRKEKLDPPITVEWELSPTQSMYYRERWRRIAVVLNRERRLSPAEINTIAEDYANRSKDERRALIVQAKALGWVGDNPPRVTRPFSC